MGEGKAARPLMLEVTSQMAMLCLPMLPLVRLVPHSLGQPAPSLQHHHHPVWSSALQGQVKTHLNVMARQETGAVLWLSMRTSANGQNVKAPHRQPQAHPLPHL